MENGVSPQEEIPPGVPPQFADRPLPEFRCIGCGYGATCRIAPERCPMCGGTTWGHAGSKQSTNAKEH
jgi:rubrerythrin